VFKSFPVYLKPHLLKSIVVYRYSFGMILVPRSFDVEWPGSLWLVEADDFHFHFLHSLIPKSAFPIIILLAQTEVFPNYSWTHRSLVPITRGKGSTGAHRRVDLIPSIIQPFPSTPSPLQWKTQPINNTSIPVNSPKGEF